VPPARLGNLLPRLDLLQDPDDLFLGKLRLLHSELLSSKKLYLQVSSRNEDATSGWFERLYMP